jgi:DNA polymerase-3 subunit gamma/tau
MALAPEQKLPAARLVASNPEPTAPASAPQPAVKPSPTSTVKLPTSLEDIAVICADKREIRLKFAVERQMRPVKFEPGRIEIALTAEADRDMVQELARKLSDWTGTRWLVVVSREEGGPTIAEGREAAQDQLLNDARSDPLVAAVMRRFPGARIVDIRVERSAEEEAARVVASVPAGTGEDAGIDPDALDDDAPLFEADDPGWLPEE